MSSEKVYREAGTILYIGYQGERRNQLNMTQINLVEVVGSHCNL